MDGIHDMGGMHGFGKVEPEQDEPVFHAPWEGQQPGAFNRAMGAIGAWSIDEGRAAIEALPPDVYLASPYYAKWALRLENMVIARGLAGADEIAAGHAARSGIPLGRKLEVTDVPRTLARGSFGRTPQSEARFKVGDRVRAKNIHPPTHTRLPRYARGHVGAIEAVRGCHVFPGLHGRKGRAKIRNGSTRTVLFEGRELWGEASDPTLKGCPSKRSSRILDPRFVNYAARSWAARDLRAMLANRCFASRGKRRRLLSRSRCESAASFPQRNGQRRWAMK